MRAVDQQPPLAWGLAWKPFANSSDQAAKYVVHLPHNLIEGFQLLHRGVILLNKIGRHQQSLSERDKNEQTERLAQAVADYVADIFIRFDLLQLKGIQRMSQDSYDLVNIYLAAKLSLNENICLPLLASLNSIVVGLSANFGGPSVMRPPEILTADQLKNQLFEGLGRLTLKKTFDPKKVKSTQIMNFLQHHAIFQDSLSFNTISETLRLAIKNNKGEKKHLLQCCSSILENAPTQIEIIDTPSMTASDIDLFDSDTPPITPSKKTIKNKKTKDKRKEKKREQQQAREDTNNLQESSACVIQKQMRLHFMLRSVSATTLQQHYRDYLHQKHSRLRQKSSITITNFFLYCRDIGIKQKSALIIQSFLMKSHYRKQAPLVLNQLWFSMLKKNTQLAALAIRDLVLASHAGIDMIVYGSRLLEGSKAENLLIDRQTDLDILGIIPSDSNLTVFMNNLWDSLGESEEFDYLKGAASIEEITIASERKRIRNCQIVSRNLNYPLIDLTLIQYDSDIPCSRISASKYLSMSPVHADRFSIHLNTVGKLNPKGVNVLSQRQLLRSVQYPDFSRANQFSRNNIRNCVKKLLRAVMLGVVSGGADLHSIRPAEFVLPILTKESFDRSKILLCEEVARLFDAKPRWLELLVNSRLLGIFYSLLPRIKLHNERTSIPFNPTLFNPTPFDPILFDPILFIQYYCFDESYFNELAVRFNVQHFLFQTHKIDTYDYIERTKDPLDFLQTYVHEIQRRGDPVLWVDFLNLFDNMQRQSTFIADYSMIRRKLFALQPVLHPNNQSGSSFFEEPIAADKKYFLPSP